MSTAIVYADFANDDVAFLTSRSPVAATSIEHGTISLGSPGYFVALSAFFSASEYWTQETFLAFDTSALAGVTVSGASLSIYDQVGSDELQARFYDFGAGDPSVGDWVDGSDLAALPLLAHLTLAGVNGWKEMTTDDLAANIVTGGVTRMVFATERQVAGDAGTSAYAQFGDFNTLPYLTIHYATPPESSLVVYATDVADMGSLLSYHATDMATAMEHGTIAAPSVGGAVDIGYYAQVHENFSVGRGALEAFLAFDTSALAGATITEAVLWCWGTPAIWASPTSNPVAVLLHDFTEPVTTADWVDGSDLSGKTLLAHSEAPSGVQPLIGDALIENIAAGVTRMVAVSQFQLDLDPDFPGTDVGSGGLVGAQVDTLRPFLSINYIDFEGVPVALLGSAL